MHQTKSNLWNNANTKMIEVRTISSSEFFTNGTCAGNEELIDDVMLEYTGLHDRAGKEIWKGCCFFHSNIWTDYILILGQKILM